MIILLGLMLGTTSVRADAAWPCFSSKTCFTSPWSYESSNSNIDQSSKAEPQAKLSLKTEEDLENYITELALVRKECQASNTLPPYDGPSEGVSEKDALAAYVKEHELELRAYLNCDLDKQSVDQIISYPGDAIGSPEDTEQLAESERYTLSSEFADCRNYFSILRGRSENQIETSALVTKSAFREYRANCFDMVDAAPEAVRNRLVFLGEFKGSKLRQIYCAGILINHDIVLTAKHCLVDPAEIEDFYSTYGKSEKKFSIQNVRLKRNTRLVAPFISPYVFPNIAPLDQSSFYPNRPEADHILLRIQGLNYELPTLALSPANKWDRIMVAGILPNDPTETSLESVDAADIANWVSSRIVVDARPSCYVAQLQDGCILHQCQTFAGFSGAPIVRIADGALVGVHSASLDISENVCSFRRSAIIRNRASDLFGIRADSQGE
ncbi:trypsin-like peptidase domain-containing protein [Ruegeria sp. 2205SS24-7]|uniref:trypsin-like serine peptidase n=1 Tax=Ruegeria discodermiae TaxID=3064389 RepID=UPI00274094AC|nr:serine protease [Ruegeria sp. 2205SS24-7]MDP5220043.1 trypsin-like peptidase domain-containing protein [Ruegeria sp. 2205SS24-7]